MADTTTTYLDIVKPELASSRDTWGVKLNQGLDKIDAVFADDGSGTSVGLCVGADKVLDATDGSVQLGKSNWSIDGVAIAVTADELNILSGGIAAVGSLLMPVGFTFETTNSANPSTYYGFGTWELYGAGKVVAGYLAGDSAFGTAGSTGGSKDAVLVSHTHTATSIATITDPGHYHTLSNSLRPPGGYAAGGDTIQMQGSTPQSGNTSTQTTGITATVSTEVSVDGVSATNANLQPYVVMYRWRRTL